MVVLETIDFDMLNLIENAPHITMYKTMVNNAHVGPLKQNPKASYEDDGRSLISLEVKARIVRRNSLPCHVYHLVQNYESDQEMIETLTVAYEGIMEVQDTTINKLNR